MNANDFPAVARGRGHDVLIEQCFDPRHEYGVHDALSQVLDLGSERRERGSFRDGLDEQHLPRPIIRAPQ